MWPFVAGQGRAPKWPKKIMALIYRPIWYQTDTVLKTLPCFFLHRECLITYYIHFLAMNTQFGCIIQITIHILKTVHYIWRTQVYVQTDSSPGANNIIVDLGHISRASFTVGRDLTNINVLLDASPKVLATEPLEQIDGNSTNSEEQNATFPCKVLEDVAALSSEALKTLNSPKIIESMDKIWKQKPKQTAYPPALSNEVISEAVSEVVSEESESSSPPESEHYWVNVFEILGHSKLTRYWMDSKQLNKDNDRKRWKEIEKMKRMKERGRPK